MNIAFRADSSLDIGTGHIMRCLALAKELTKLGSSCAFICQDKKGNIGSYILDQGYELLLIPDFINNNESTYACCEFDSLHTKIKINNRIFDWLVVDNYSLDEQWEISLRNYYKKLLVIDDLANRVHRCDILLDQNLGRTSNDYINLLPSATQIYLGPNYSLLRSEFNDKRTSINELAFSAHDPFRLVISMGGIDYPNSTGTILQTLENSINLNQIHITLIVGKNSPHLGSLAKSINKSRFDINLLSNVTNMANILVDNDLAIGTSGHSSWERCCLGLPSIIITIAKNQISGAKALEKAGAAVYLGNNEEINVFLPKILNDLIINKDKIFNMRKNCFDITDGLGAKRIAKILLS